MEKIDGTGEEIGRADKYVKSAFYLLSQGVEEEEYHPGDDDAEKLDKGVKKKVTVEGGGIQASKECRP